MTLDLTIEEYNLVYKAVTKLTIEEGLPLLRKISMQATKQTENNPNITVEDPLNKE